MRGWQPGRSVVPVMVAAGFLVLFSATGLMAGTVVAGFSPARSGVTGTTSHHSSSPTTTSTANPVPGATHATATVASSQLVTTAFKLILVASPNPATTGHLIHVTVHAVAESTSLPLPGVMCQLEGPEAGGPALFPAWPAAKVTDSNGAASWDLMLPSMQQGVYSVGVTSVGTKWSYHSQINVTVTTGV